MRRRLRASKARVRITLQDALFLRGRTRAQLVSRYGSEEMALAYWRAHRTDLAYWRAHRTDMLQRGYETPELPPHWHCSRADCERHRGGS
jgi:hypothetical protein